jgi:hypothetical protein
LSLYPRLNRIIGQIGLPWYNIGGNHDLNYEAPSAKYRGKHSSEFTDHLIMRSNTAVPCF